MKKIITSVFVFLILIASIYALDLSDYPSMFIKDGKFDGVIVVDDKAFAEEIIAAQDISLGLQGTTCESSCDINPGQLRLASEIDDPKEINLIYIDSKCNSIMRALLEVPYCEERLKEGEATLKLLNHNGKAQLMVTGYSPSEIRDAGKILKNYQEYDLSGKEIKLNTDDYDLEVIIPTIHDLSEYPDFYIDDGELDVAVVVGAKGSAVDVLVQSQIVLSLGRFGNAMGISKLARETDFDQENIISIGSPCDNPISYQLLGYPKPCDKDIKTGEAFIRLVESGGHVHIVVVGYNSEALREVAKALINYDNYDLKGNKYVIEFESETEEKPEEVETAIEEQKQEIEEKIIEEKEESKEQEKMEEETKAEEKEEQKEEEPKKPAVTIIPKETKEENIIIKIMNWFKQLFGIK